MKIEPDEKELLETVERGEWKSAAAASASGLATRSTLTRRSASIRG